MVAPTREAMSSSSASRDPAVYPAPRSYRTLTTPRSIRTRPPIATPPTPLRSTPLPTQLPTSRIPQCQPRRVWETIRRRTRTIPCDPARTSSRARPLARNLASLVSHRRRSTIPTPAKAVSRSTSTVSTSTVNLPELEGQHSSQPLLSQLPFHRAYSRPTRSSARGRSATALLITMTRQGSSPWATTMSGYAYPATATSVPDSISPTRLILQYPAQPRENSSTPTPTTRCRTACGR